eukprot:1152100-Pelagomonas_calceolata.AAC.3
MPVWMHVLAGSMYGCASVCVRVSAHHACARACAARCALPSQPQAHLDRIDVLADATHVLVHAHASSVDLLGVHTVLGVQVLHLAVRVHPMNARGEGRERPHCATEGA